MQDLMIDLETMGINSNAVITQIGACFFNRDTGEITKKFLQNVTISSCLKAGLEVDESTILWWMKQSDEARKSVYDNKDDMYPLQKALLNFKIFFPPGLRDIVYTWSHATFDFVILLNAFKKIDLQSPFSYRRALDIRTLVHLVNLNYKDETFSEGLHIHNALDDCIRQVRYVVEALKLLKGGA